MNALNFCFIGLLVLGALTQAKEADTSSKLDKTIEETADVIANYVGSLIRERKVNVLKKFANGAKALKGQPDACAFHKANRIASLRSEYQAAGTCTLVQDVVTSVRSVIVNGTHIVLDLIGNTVTAVTSVVSCLITHPLAVECILGQVKTLLGELVDTVPEVVSFLVSTTQGVGSLIASLIKCLNLQNSIEQRFDEILSSACP